ncbi:MAG: hypothetical protein AAF170_02520 [Bacteroidota bacterium]
MSRLATLALLLALTPLASAQTVTVETIVPEGSAIDDALAIGPDGALYGSRFGGTGQTVTRVNLETGVTSTYATGFSRANGLSFGPDGSLYAANYGRGQIRKVLPGGASSVFYQASGTTLSGVAYDLQNDVIYIASYDGDWIRRLSTSGEATEIELGGLEGPAGLAFDDQNRLHIANFDNGRIFRFTGSGLTLLADLRTQVGFLAYGGGQFYATGINTHLIYQISPSGEVTTLAGTGTAGLVDGPASTAQFNKPNGIVSNVAGDTLYVSDSRTRAIRRIVIQTVTSAEEGPLQTGALLAPSPNPATSSTQIRFQLDAPEYLEMALHDSLGRRVRSLGAAVHPAGDHTLDIDLDGLAPGLYVVTMHRDGRAESRSFVRR